MISVEKHQKLYNSGLIHTFTPGAPISSAELLAGREEEIDLIAGALLRPGFHCVVLGHKGIGKTSVANVAMEIARAVENKTILRRECASDFTFMDMMEPLIKAAGHAPHVVSTQRSVTTGGGGNVNLGIARADASQQKTESVTMAGARAWAHTVSDVAEAVRHLNVVLLLDEVDKVAKNEMKKLAEFIKHLSNDNAPLKLLLAGTDTTVQALAAGHMSVLRCVASIVLKKMDDCDIMQIVAGGAKKLGLTFAPEVIKKIVNMSSGFPYFTHLIAFKLAEQAILEDRTQIDAAHLPLAVQTAIKEVESELSSAYHTVISQGNEAGRDKVIKILIAAAIAPDPAAIRASQWLEACGRLWGAEIGKGALNNYMGRVVTSNGAGLITRTARSLYQFNDPRMPSFIKLANLEKLPRNGRRA